MKIDGKPPAIRSPDLHPADKAEQIADEVAGQRAQEARTVVPMGPVEITRQRLDEISQSERPPDVGGMVAAADPDSISGFRRGVQEKLIALAATDFAPEQQREFTRYLDRNLNLPDDIGRLAWVKSKVAYLARENPDLDVSELSHYFRGKGLRLHAWDSLPAKHSGYQVDRMAFRARIKEALPSGTIDRRTALALLSQCNEVADVDDLFWCKNQISRYVDNGKLEFADAKTEVLVNRFFETKLAGRVGNTEWGWELRRLRHSGFAAGNVDRVRNMIDGCAEDPDALFYARRQLTRETKKALAKADELPEDERAALIGRIHEVQAELKPTLDVRLDGQLDRYVVETRIERMARDGKIDERELLAMRAALSTSRTHEDFAYGCMTVQVQLALVKAQNVIMEAWNDLLEELEEEKVERQEEERLVELQYRERIELERQVERMRLEPRKLEELGERAWLRGSRQRILNLLAGEGDPNRRAGLEASLAQSDIELVDLDQPLEPKS